MKRLYVALFLTALITGICASSNIFLNRYVDYVDMETDRITDAILQKDYRTASELCGRIFSEHKKKENFLVACTHHDDLEKIPSIIKECETLLYYSDEIGIVLSRIQMLKAVLDDIRDSSNISVYSLL